MPSVDERFLTSDPIPGAGWQPKVSRKGLPKVSISRKWAPRSGGTSVGSGQSYPPGTTPVPMATPASTSPGGTPGGVPDYASRFAQALAPVRQSMNWALGQQGLPPIEQQGQTQGTGRPFVGAGASSWMPRPPHPTDPPPGTITDPRSMPAPAQTPRTTQTPPVRDESNRVPSPTQAPGTSREADTGGYVAPAPTVTQPTPRSGRGPGMASPAPGIDNGDPAWEQQYGESGANLRPTQYAYDVLTREEAIAACGPAAAVAFARAHGRNPTLREAMDLAYSVGVTDENGTWVSMAGPDSEAALLKKMGVAATVEWFDPSAPSWDHILEDVRSGSPVLLSAGVWDGIPHYYTVTDYDPSNDSFYVGTSGTDVRGRGEWMTREQLNATGIQAALFSGENSVAANSEGAPVESVDPAVDAETTQKLERINTAVQSVGAMAGGESGVSSMVAGAPAGEAPQLLYDPATGVVYQRDGVTPSAIVYNPATGQVTDTRTGQTGTTATPLAPRPAGERPPANASIPSRPPEQGAVDTYTYNPVSGELTDPQGAVHPPSSPVPANASIPSQRPGPQGGNDLTVDEIVQPRQAPQRAQPQPAGWTPPASAQTRSADAGATAAELHQAATWAARADQWNVSYEDALAELQSGTPESQAYLQNVLGMIRSGQLQSILNPPQPGTSAPDAPQSAPASQQSPGEQLGSNQSLQYSPTTGQEAPGFSVDENGMTPTAGATAPQQRQTTRHVSTGVPMSWGGKPPQPSASGAPLAVSTPAPTAGRKRGAWQPR